MGSEIYCGDDENRDNDIDVRSGQYNETVRVTSRHKGYAIY